MRTLTELQNDIKLALVGLDFKIESPMTAVKEFLKLFNSSLEIENYDVSVVGRCIYVHIRYFESGRVDFIVISICEFCHSATRYELPPRALARMTMKHDSRYNWASYGTEIYERLLDALEKYLSGEIDKETLDAETYLARLEWEV